MWRSRDSDRLRTTLSPTLLFNGRADAFQSALVAPGAAQPLNVKVIMKLAFTIVLAVAVLIGLGSMFGLVGVRYPRVITDEPLKHPQKVVRIEGTKLSLADGAVVTLEGVEEGNLSNILWQSEFTVDIDESTGGDVGVWARQNGWVCGTPWAQPIRIPLIRDTVYKNRRQMIALCSVMRPGGQPGGAANQSQPVRPQTNSMSAAGSRR